MLSNGSAFKFLFRNRRETLVLVPGWAADERVFETLDLDFNYVVPEGFSPLGFTEELLSFLDTIGSRKVSLLGWSMGGFGVSDFARAHPGRVHQVFLAGARPQYGKSELEKTRSSLGENAKAFLYKFYGTWFAPAQESARQWFKQRLLQDYLNRVRTDDLTAALEYLESAKLDPAALPAEVVFIHGRQDKIAPIEEILKLKEALPKASYIALPEAGHAVFLNPDFAGIFNGAVRD